MKTLFVNAKLWHHTPDCDFVAGELAVANGVIVACGAPDTLPRDSETDVIDVGGALIAPGLIDVHTHGRAGGDFASADVETLRRMAHSYAETGTTTVMPTLASAPLEDYVTAAERIAATADTEQGARWLGLHLEGRYLNPEKRGAHAAELLAPLDASELSALHERMCRPFATPPVLRLSAALELDTDGRFAQAARQKGILLSLGHTAATYAEAIQAIENGAHCLTHLFNAMPPMHHRAGGPIAACFDTAARGGEVYGELICDGLHIAPEMIRLAWRALGPDHTLLITDSMQGTGCPDGDYAIAGQRVILKQGRALTEDGALAGSTLSLWEAVCNLSDMCDISLAEAIRCATYNAARLIGQTHRLGSLEVGCSADLLVIDNSSRTVQAVFVQGREVRSS